MRASGATNCGLPFSVVAFTNSTIAFLAAPSFQDGSGPAPSAVEGSVWAYAWASPSKNKNPAPTILFIILRFIEILLSWDFSSSRLEGETLDRAVHRVEEAKVECPLSLIPIGRDGQGRFALGHWRYGSLRRMAGRVPGSGRSRLTLIVLLTTAR